jgi:GTP-binding protein EngB required for normal cell division
MLDVPPVDHAQLTSVLAGFRDLQTSLGEAEAAQRLEPLFQRYRTGLFRLAVVGEEKRGKSSFINALLDHPNLVPVGTAATTATVFKIIFGPAIRYRAFFLPLDPDQPEASRPKPRDVSAAEAAALGSAVHVEPQDGAPVDGNQTPCGERLADQSGVEFIGVECPHPLLQTGLVVVDLPGLGGLNREHALITRRYLPQADVVVFIVDSTTAVLTREEVATLKLLRQRNCAIVMVQTKIDAVGRLQWQTWRDRNQEILASTLGLKSNALPYFTVSSETKLAAKASADPDDLAQSGFPLLEQFLTDRLIPAKRDYLAAPLLVGLAEEMARIDRRLENEIALLGSGQGESERLEAELRESQHAYDQWKLRELPGLLKAFNQEFDQAVDDAAMRIMRDLDPSGYGPIAGRLIRDIEQSGVGAKQIADQATQLNDTAVAVGADILEGISADFDRRVYTAYDEATIAIGHAARPVVIRRQAAAGDLVFEHVEPKVRSSLIDLARQGQSGMLLGAGVATLVATALFPPLSLPTLAIVALAGLFGARRSIVDAQTRQRDQVIQQLRNLISDTTRRLQQHGRYELERAARRTRTDMLAALAVAVEARDREFKQALAALGEKRRQSKEVLGQQLRTKREELARTQALNGLIASVRPAAGEAGRRGSAAA